MVEKFQIENMLDWGVKTFKKIGLVHSTTGYADFAAKEIQEGLKARNAQLVAVESAAPNVSDLTPQMLKMKEAGAELVLEFPQVVRADLPADVEDRLQADGRRQLGTVLAEGPADRRAAGDRRHRDGSGA